MFLISTILAGYQWMIDNGDKRVESWTLMKSPIGIVSILITYLYVIKVLGPSKMKTRQPFELKNLIIFYNFIMVVSSLYFFIYGLKITYLSGRYNLICTPVDYSYDEFPMKFVNLGWWYLLLKLVELLDTIFFVMRKKFSQISPLHVIHHTSVPWFVWVCLRYGAGGHHALFAIINSLVHVIMYTYYFLSAFGPHMQKYLWWKKYLTVIQMAQFVIVIAHQSIPLVVDCGFSPYFSLFSIGHSLLFFVLFSHFYLRSYSENKRQAKKEFDKLSSNNNNNYKNGIKTD